jgi:hypothetical protein
MSNRDFQDQKSIRNSDVDRRKILLGGTALAAASARRAACPIASPVLSLRLSMTSQR